MNKVYIQRAMSYKERIRAIQGVGGSFEPQQAEEKPPTEESASGETPSSEPKKASFEELVLKEKPMVKWDEVVGL